MTLPTATAGETAGVLADLVAPLVARGVIVRRPRIEGALDRLDADRRAVRRLQALRRHHGDAPVLLRLPGRDVVIVLAPDDVRRVLDGTPEPFAAASREKRAALGHFQPNGVLVSPGPGRADRRRFNEDVPQPGRPEHELAPAFVAVVQEEAAPLLSGGELGWERFAQAWWRIVRRVVLGTARATTTPSPTC